MDMQLKKVLKALLQEKNMSVAHLARVTHVPRQTLDNWLSGQEPRHLQQVKDVADHLHVPLDYLCFGEMKRDSVIKIYESEINAGYFEVILRKAKR